MLIQIKSMNEYMFAILAFQWIRAYSTANVSLTLARKNLDL